MYLIENYDDSFLKLYNVLKSETWTCYKCHYVKSGERFSDAESETCWTWGSLSDFAAIFLSYEPHFESLVGRDRQRREGETG